MLRRSKAISKKRDRPAPARGRCEVERRGRCCLLPGGAVSVRVVGGGVGGPGLNPRDQVAGVGRGRKKRDSFAGALLAQGTLACWKMFELSGEYSQSRRVSLGWQDRNRWQSN